LPQNQINQNNQPSKNGMNKSNKDKCSICYNSQYGDKDGIGKMSKRMCLDNPEHPTYDERYDCWDGLTYLDCWNFIRSNETEEEWKSRVFKQNTKSQS
jgi:hypothetical protein